MKGINQAIIIIYILKNLYSQLMFIEEPIIILNILS